MGNASKREREKRRRAKIEPNVTRAIALRNEKANTSRIIHNLHCRNKVIAKQMQSILYKQHSAKMVLKIGLKFIKFR